MGGIKNRDAKRAAAKVFSSGGGGGSKGPAVLDKRGEELPCPHCDRIFKQSGRLKDHIAKQHADTLGPDGGGASTSAAAAPAAAAPAQQQPASKPPSRPGTAGGPAKAAVTAAATAAASTAPKAPGSGGGGGAAGGSAGPSAGAGGDKVMMDVGARGGYFDEKSPKLLLHEWCTRNKRPKPRYVAQKAPGGQHGCKVVLPDPKGVAERDMVVFLDASLVAPDADEAAQRGAVAALHAVQGDRSLDYVLPARYRMVWRELGQKAAQREAKKASAAEKAAQKRERAAARKAAADRRGAANVVMSEEQRRRIEALLRGLDGTIGAGLGGDDDYGDGLDGSEGSEDEDSEEEEVDEAAAEAVRRLAAELAGLGFEERDAAAAAKAVGGGGGAGVALPAALDWLCLSLPEDRLPRAFAPGASSTISVVRTAGSGLSASRAAAAAEAADAAAAAEAASSDPNVGQLAAYGYPQDHAMAALQAAGGCLPAALAALFAALLPRDGADAGDADGAALAAALEASFAGPGSERRPRPEAWAEEREVLEAIYGQEVAYPEPGRAVITVDWPEARDRVELHVLCPPAAAAGSGAASYPDVPPAVAVRCDRLAPAARLSLTARLAAEAARLAAGGHLAAHDLAVALSEALEEEGDTLLTGGAAGGGRRLRAPPPYDRSLKAAAAAASRAEAEAEAAEQQRQQEAAAAAADQRRRGPPQGAPQRRRPRTGAVLSPEAAAAESRRLLDEAARLKANPGHAQMRATRAALPAAAKRGELLAAASSNDVVVISGATGCGKSTQVPQYLLEEAVEAGHGGATSIIVTQPRRIAATGLAARVAAERGEELGGVVGYSVRLDSNTSARTRLLFCTTGVLLRRLMSDPDLTGVTHLVLDEVHERGCESDLLLLLIRRLLARRAAAAAAAAAGGARGPRGPGAAPPPKLLLMSATADAELFAGYFRKPPGGPGAASAHGKRGGGGRLGVGCLTIPGFTHPVREMWLEDALAATGFRVGPGSRWAKKKLPRAEPGGAARPARAAAAAAAAAGSQAGAGEGGDEYEGLGWDEPQEDEGGDGGGGANGGAAAADGAAAAGTQGSSGDQSYSADVLRSCEVMDASLVNYDLIELLVAHIVGRTQRDGPTALLQGWRDAPPGALAPPRGRDAEAGAVLVFLPGAPEIDRCVRQLQASPKLAAAAGGAQLRVLPLHGSLPAGAQARVFERGGRGVVKIVCATNVAETSITIDDVVAVVDTGRVKETGYDAEKGLSRLQEGWASQAAAQQRRGRAGRVRPGWCFRLIPRDYWGCLAPQQAPEVLRVPLEQLCLSAKAALADIAAASAAAGDHQQQQQQQPEGDERLQAVLGELLTPPPESAADAAVARLTALGALAPGSQELTALGRHLTAMPMDAKDGKALIYGCMLRCAGPMLTIAAARAHGRSVFVSPHDKRSEAEAARRALAPAAYDFRSDHLALVAAFAGWEAARRRGGRRAAAEFSGRNFLSDQAMEAIAAGRVDFANTLASLGFLPEWYVHEMRSAGGGKGGAAAAGAKGAGSVGGAAAADAYGFMAAAAGGPDEFSGNSRMIKAALCAGFYPSILRVEEPKRYAQVEGGAFRVDADAKEVKLFERNLGRVFVHPASVCFAAGGYKTGWALFTEMVQTSKRFVREVSMVGHYALLLCAGRLEVMHAAGEVLLDGWARLRLRARGAVLFARLRGAVEGALAAKVEDPGLDLGGHPAVEAMLELIARDGA